MTPRRSLLDLFSQLSDADPASDSTRDALATMTRPEFLELERHVLPIVRLAAVLEGLRPRFELPHVSGFQWRDDVLVHASLPEELVYALLVERHRDGRAPSLVAVRVADPAQRAELDARAVAWALGDSEVLPEPWALVADAPARTAHVPGVARRVRFDGEHLQLDDGPSSLTVQGAAVRTLLQHTHALDDSAPDELSTARDLLGVVLQSRDTLDGLVDEPAWLALERAVEATTLIDCDLAFGVWFDAMAAARGAWQRCVTLLPSHVLVAIHGVASQHVTRLSPPGSDDATLRIVRSDADV